GRKPAEREARRFRKRGLRGSAKALAELAGDVGGESVLEVGGGVGTIEIALLESGAARATNVELAATYEDTARALLAERGLSVRASRPPHRSRGRGAWAHARDPSAPRTPLGVGRLLSELTELGQSLVELRLRRAGEARSDDYDVAGLLARDVLRPLSPLLQR